jgi:hypothetical protein
LSHLGIQPRPRPSQMTSITVKAENHMMSRQGAGRSCNGITAAERDAAGCSTATGASQLAHHTHSQAVAGTISSLLWITLRTAAGAGRCQSIAPGKDDVRTLLLMSCSRSTRSGSRRLPTAALSSANGTRTVPPSPPSLPPALSLASAPGGLSAAPAAPRAAVLMMPLVGAPPVCGAS